MDSEYLKKSVGKYLSKALCEVAVRRPERPIEFLAYHLIALYEKDLELQRSDKTLDFEEKNESIGDLTTIPDLPQLFMRKLSSSMSKELDSISPAAASPSISIGLDEAFTEEDEPELDKESLLVECLTDSDEEKTQQKTDIKSSDENDKVLTKIKTESVDDDDEAVHKTLDLTLAEIYKIPERKPSAIRDNDPVTEEEVKEFGTADPFLARRNTNLFDVNFAPIGDPSNQPKPSL